MSRHLQQLAERRDGEDRGHSEMPLPHSSLDLEAAASTGDSSVAFEEIFDLAEIQRIQDAFASATGVASVITDLGGRAITRPSNACHLCENVIRQTDQGRKDCAFSERTTGRRALDGPVSHPCLGAGLWEGGTRICVGSRHVANWLVGQVLDRQPDIDALMAYARRIGADETVFREALREVPRMPRDQFDRVCRALHVIADQISRMAAQNLEQRRLINDLRRAEQARGQLEDQLRHSQRVRAVGQFAGGVAHDFNNLLTVILGNVALMRVHLTEGSEPAELIQDIGSAAERAADLTKQLLAFSRRQTMQFEAVSPSEVVDETASLLRRVIGERITLECEATKDLPVVHGDPGMLQQVLMNLAVNARDAMVTGGTLTIRAAVQKLTRETALRDPEARPGEFVAISVSDTGCGMTPETLGRLFEPYFTTKPVGYGTGLGLATAYGIAKQHGGWIEVQSELGRGSTFTVLVPTATPASGAPAAMPSQADALRGNETILVVEDDASVRRLLCQVLEQRGYRVLCAGDAIEALQRFRAHEGRVDLLFSDLVMPLGVSGAELAREVRTVQPDIQILLTTGYSQTLGERELSIVPDAEFVPKPYEVPKLLQVIRDCLDARKAGAGAIRVA